MFAPTRHELAESRMRKAKAAMTAATAAILRGDPDGAQLGDEALALLTAAQAELAALDAEPQA